MYHTAVDSLFTDHAMEAPAGRGGRVFKHGHVLKWAKDLNLAYRWMAMYGSDVFILSAFNAAAAACKRPNEAKQRMKWDGHSDASTNACGVPKPTCSKRSVGLNIRLNAQ